jgi:hypothetical protein
MTVWLVFFSSPSTWYSRGPIVTVISSPSIFTTGSAGEAIGMTGRASGSGSACSICPRSCISRRTSVLISCRDSLSGDTASVFSGCRTYSRAISVNRSWRSST